MKPVNKWEIHTSDKQHTADAIHAIDTYAAIYHICEEAGGDILHVYTRLNIESALTDAAVYAADTFTSMVG